MILDRLYTVKKVTVRKALNKNLLGNILGNLTSFMMSQFYVIHPKICTISKYVIEITIRCGLYEARSYLGLGRFAVFIMNRYQDNTDK